MGLGWVCVNKGFHIGDAVAKKACVKRHFCATEVKLSVQTDHDGKWQNQCENPYSKYHAQLSFMPQVSKFLDACGRTLAANPMLK